MNTSHRPLARLACIAAVSIPVAALAQPDCLQQRLVGEPGLATAFGRKMTMSDRHLIIGDSPALSRCPGGDPFSCTGGAIYVYERSGDALFLTQTIIPWDITHEGFGVSVAIDPLNPNRMMTASATRIHEGVWGVGYLYEFDGEEWRETSRFYPPPGAHPTTDFARFIVLRGDTALVEHGGSVYRYREIGGQWLHEQTISKPEAMQPASVSFAQGGIELGDDWAFVTAPRDRSQGPLHGAVAVYSRDADGTLTFVQHLLPPAEASGIMGRNQFGYDIAFDGQTLAVGAHTTGREFEGQGAVFVYELEGDEWVLRQELESSGASEGHHLGQGLSVQGDTMLVGHAQASGDIFKSYLFTRGADGLWRESAILRPGDIAPALPLYFGRSSTMHGRWAVVGAHHETQTGSIPPLGPGAAYAYDLECLTEGCPVDLDGDDQLTIFDFLMFQNLFDAGDMQADFDGDGELTIFDFLAFQTAFDAGCE